MIIHPPQKIILAKSAVQIANPASDTVENTVLTVAVPGNLIGLNGSVYAIVAYSRTNNANQVTVRVRLAGTNFSGAAIASVSGWRGMWEIANVNSLAVQNGHPITGTSGGFSGSLSAFLTGAVDTSIDQNLTLTVQKATGTDVVNIEMYEIYVVPRA